MGGWLDSTPPQMYRPSSKCPGCETGCSQHSTCLCFRRFWWALAVWSQKLDRHSRTFCLACGLWHLRWHASEGTSLERMISLTSPTLWPPVVPSFYECTDALGGLHQNYSRIQQLSCWMERWSQDWWCPHLLPPECILGSFSEIAYLFFSLEVSGSASLVSVESVIFLDLFI